MESSPDFILISNSEDEPTDDKSSQPLQPLRRSRRLLRRGDDMPNTSQAHHSFIPKTTSRFHGGRDDSGTRPLRRSLRIRQSATNAALVSGLVRQAKIEPQPDFIAVLESEEDEADDSLTQAPHRFLQQRQGEVKSAQPRQVRRQHKLISRRAAFRPKPAVKGKPLHQNRPRDEKLWTKMYAASQGSFNLGICSLCSRTIHTITVHHVHPRVDRERRGPAGFTEEQLKKTIPACLSCHGMIHHLIPNDIMGSSHYTVEMLRSHPRVMAWIDWVTKQPVPKPPTALVSPDMLVSGLTKKQIKKAERQGNQRAKPTKLFGLRKELEEIWIENGNTFPRWSDNEGTVKSRRHELVKELRNRVEVAVRINVPSVQKAMRPLPQYREWYLWVFDDTQVASGSVTANAPNALGAVGETQAGVAVEVARARSVVPGVTNIVAGAANVLAGMPGVIAGAMSALAGAVGMIDLTGEVSGDDDERIDVNVNGIQGKIVIDLTGDDSD